MYTHSFLYMLPGGLAISYLTVFHSGVWNDRTQQTGRSVISVFLVSLCPALDPSLYLTNPCGCPAPYSHHLGQVEESHC